MGLKGTGSADIEIENVFVPEHRIISRVEQRDGTAKGTKTHNDKLYSTPYLTIGPAALAAVVVGCAAGGLREFIQFAKMSSKRGVKLCERESIQLRIAESATEVDCAKFLIERLAQTTTYKMRSFGSLSIEERAQARRDTAYACTLAKRSVERLFDVSGANGLYTDRHFQRYYRDVKAGSNHIVIGWDRCGSTYGRVVLGLEPGLDEI
jgi:3-hydroxy-9,10-secoandrosta-1,3,5(10)-triene-9,17-dione monooxygenase